MENKLKNENLSELGKTMKELMEQQKQLMKPMEKDEDNENINKLMSRLIEVEQINGMLKKEKKPFVVLSIIIFNLRINILTIGGN